MSTDVRGWRPLQTARQEQLFSGVALYLAPTLSPEVRDGIYQLLKANGGEFVSLKDASLIVSDTDAFDGWRDVGSNVDIVTPCWVYRSLTIGVQEDTQCFSPNPNQIFSGIIACSGDLPTGDEELARAVITALGGQWREALTRNVTHLFCLTTDSDKYSDASSDRAENNIRILLPQWLYDSSQALRLIPYGPYSFPNPPLLGACENIISAPQTTLVADNELFFETVILDFPTGSESGAGAEVWHGLRVFLSSSLDLSAEQREAVTTLLKRGGANVVVADQPGEELSELAVVEKCDVLVTRYRCGPIFASALRRGRVIGTLQWVFYVDRTGKYTAPTDRLLHFPVPNWPIQGFPELQICITNYAGASRSYMKKLITIAGANFTETLTRNNTQVIAACIGGKKAEKASAWGTLVVNQLWLEDCVLHWKYLSPSNERYLRFPQTGSLAETLGECAMGRYTVEMWEKEKRPLSAYKGLKASTEWNGPGKLNNKRPQSESDSEAKPSKRARPDKSPRKTAAAQTSGIQHADARVVQTKPSTFTPESEVDRAEPESEQADVDGAEREEIGIDEVANGEGSSPNHGNGPAIAKVTRRVFYFATQVVITQDQKRVLSQLGAKPATNPEQVTHLIADQVVRTRKFLTSINYAPFIVNSQWVQESVKQKCLLAEDKYLLDHAASAEKYGVNLRESISLAAKNKAALLRGCTFFVTKKAVPDHDLVEAVVHSAGGEVKRAVPTLRQAQHDASYVISHEDDRPAWTPLSRHGIVIYTSDFLLNGVLCQALPLNDKSYTLN